MCGISILLVHTVWDVFISLWLLRVTGYLQMDTLLYVWDQYLIGPYSLGCIHIYMAVTYDRLPTDGYTPVCVGSVSYWSMQSGMYSYLYGCYIWQVTYRWILSCICGISILLVHAVWDVFISMWLLHVTGCLQMDTLLYVWDQYLIGPYCLGCIHIYMAVTYDRLPTDGYTPVCVGSVSYWSIPSGMYSYQYGCYIWQVTYIWILSCMCGISILLVHTVWDVFISIWLLHMTGYLQMDTLLYVWDQYLIVPYCLGCIHIYVAVTCDRLPTDGYSPVCVGSVSYWSIQSGMYSYLYGCYIWQVTYRWILSCMCWISILLVHTVWDVFISIWLLHMAGYLQMDTLLYVWDQYLIGLYSPGFGTGWLVSVCTALFGLLKGKVKDVKSVSPVTVSVILYPLIGFGFDVYCLSNNVLVER